MPRDNFTMSENSGSFGMQQRQDRFDAIGDLIVGPPGPPGPQGPPGADGTVSFDELTPAQRESLRGEGVPAGGTTGQVLAKATNTDYDTEWVDQSGGSASMTILSYGNSTWADFIAAYNSNSIVYCRASSAADPSSGSQTRMAFMAYVNNATSPTSVEFQYYRSVSTHSDAQQGDQVFIYKLTSAGAWTVTVRDAFTKIAAGSNMTSSYANGTLTLNATGGGTADALPLAGGTMAGDIDMGRNKITNLPTPTYYLDAANKNYVDARYIKPSTGIPQTDLASAVQNKLDKTVVVSDSQPIAAENKLWVDTDAGTGSSYQVPTVAEMNAADAQVAAEIGIVITGKRPSIAVTAGQYVIVRNSTISGITDGLYTANAALSPSTDVTAANLTAVSGGGFNNITLRSNAVPTILEQSFTSYSAVNKMGRIAVCTIDLQNGSLNIPSGGWYNVATIPDGFLPDISAGYTNIGTTQDSSNVVAMRTFQIQSNGNIRVSITSGTYTRLYCNIVYFCK